MLVYVAKKIWSYIKKCRSILKYITVSEIIDMEPGEADSYLNEHAPALDSTPITHNNIDNAEYDLMIIVPAYNSEKWIEECILSIISQKTEYSFYAVFVNDGSKDKTGDILERYSNNKQVKIIHQSNKGYSGARNVALKNINSNYIMFVDSDDYLLPNAIQCLMDAAVKNGAEIVEGNGYRFNEFGRIAPIKKVGNNEEDQYWGGPCLKVMKSSLWENFKFPEGFLYEDTIIGSLIFQLAEKIVLIDDEVYAYRIHEESITQKHDDNIRRVDSYWIMLLMTKLQEEFNIKRDYSAYKKIMKHIVFTYRRTIFLSEQIKKAIFVSTGAFVFEYFKEYAGVKDKYYLLANALKKRDYAKYVVYCEELMF